MRTWGRGGICRPRRQASGGTSPAHTQVLDVQPPGLRETLFLLLKLPWETNAEQVNKPKHPGKRLSRPGEVTAGHQARRSLDCPGKQAPRISLCHSAGGEPGNPEAPRTGQQPAGGGGVRSQRSWRRKRAIATGGSLGPRECLDQPREGKQGEQGAQRCCWRPGSGHLRKRDGSGRKPRCLCVQIDDAWLCPQDRTQLINAHFFFILKNLRDPQNSFKGEKSAQGHAPSGGGLALGRGLCPH